MRKTVITLIIIASNYCLSYSQRLVNQDYVHNGIHYHLWSDGTASVRLKYNDDGSQYTYSGNITIPSSVYWGDEYHDSRFYTVDMIEDEAFEYSRNLTI